MSPDDVKRAEHDQSGAHAADSTSPEPGRLDRDQYRQGTRAPGLYRKVILGVIAGFAVLAVTYALIV